MATVAHPGRARRSPAPDLSALRVGAGVLAGRAAGTATKVARRGHATALPGWVALRLAPDLLTALTRARRVLVVSGTNGKTTTTRLLAAAVGAGDGDVVSNDSGANLTSGLVSALLQSRADRGTTAVLEVDEFALPAVVAATRPAVIVLLNLSRDQLDRGGEVAAHVTRWTRALAGSPQAVVVANADDPLVAASTLLARPDAQRVVWVGAGCAWLKDVPLCPRCHAPWTIEEATPWRCTACGLRRPESAWSVDGPELLLPGSVRVPADLALPGRANRANAVMALAAATSAGVRVDSAMRAIREVTDVAGRYLRVRYHGTPVRLLLSKNAAGWLEVLDHLKGSTGPVVLAVNARVVDGVDTSWLWDVPFERLTGRPVAACGERAADLSVRLRYAGVEHCVVPDPLRAVAELGPEPIELVANYSAFAAVRERLHNDVDARDGTSTETGTP